jgi:cobalt-zinc-cadmium efflux system protein
MLVDCLALGLAWAGIRIARRPADSRRSYGYRRVEVLAAWINGIVLCGVVAWVAFEAVTRLFEPVDILPMPMLAVAVAGLGANLAAFAVLRGGGPAALNVRAAMLHVLGDILGSVAVIVSAAVIMMTGWVAADPILSLAVAALIVPSAIAIVRRSTHILLEGTPAKVDTAALGADLQDAISEVADVHHVHVWSLTENHSLVTLHARFGSGAEARLAARFGLTHSVVQIEPGACPDVDLSGLSGAR